MKSIMIAVALLALAGAAPAQSSTQSDSAMPNTNMSASSKTADPTVKPKGQIILLKSATDRKQVGIRAHCSNGSVYWSPKIEEDLYYCEATDAPAPTGK